MRTRRQTAEHPLGTIKGMDGRDPLSDAHARKGENGDEPSRFTYNLKRMIAILGVQPIQGDKGRLKSLRIRTQFASQRSSPPYAEPSTWSRKAVFGSLGRFQPSSRN